MAVFLGNIAFLFSLLVFALGLVLFGYEKKTRHLATRMASIILLLAGLFFTINTGYYYTQYHLKKSFASPYAQPKPQKMRKFKQGANIWRGTKQDRRELSKRYHMKNRQPNQPRLAPTSE